MQYVFANKVNYGFPKIKLQHFFIPILINSGTVQFPDKINTVTVYVCCMLWWHTSAITCQIIMLTCQIFVVLSDLYVDLSDLYVDLTLIHLLENES